MSLAYILYSNSVSGRKLSHLYFRIEVVKGLIAKTTAQLPTSSPPANDMPAIMVGHNHFPEPAGGRHDCRVCSNRKSGKSVTVKYFSRNPMATDLL